MILFLHNRYRTTGGEERVVSDLLGLVREHLGEDAELLTRDSADLGRAEAARGLLGGGVNPGEVADAVRRSGARVVHAHNLNPALGWRALAAARAAGARVVLHLHNYRLVCAVGVCFTRGAECTRCHGRNTLPGVLLNCRGTGPEAVVYGAALARWQRRLVDHADAVIVPSRFALDRLRELGAPLPWERVHVLPPPVHDPVTASPGAPDGPALVASRLAPEKGVDTAIEACRVAGVALAVAGDGPMRAELRRRAGARVTFAGRLDRAALDALRASCSVALVPSRSAETFGLAAAEAMVAGLPVVATRVGALPELVPEQWLVPPGDATAMAAALARARGDAAGARRGRDRARAIASPAAVAAGLAEVYAGASERPAATA